MGLFERIFGKREPPVTVKEKATVFRMLYGYVPAFRTWNGSIY